MFTKTNIKYILILTLGFFWCSCLYLSQEQYLAKYVSMNFVNNVDLLFGSLAMAAGIFLFAILYKKNKNIKLVYIVFTLLSIISSIIFFLTRNIYLMSTLLCLVCMLGTAGFGAGYHFSLLANYVDKEHQGRVFAIGYGLGSLGTYFLIKLPTSFYTSISSLLIYIPVILLNLYIVLKNKNLININDESFTSSFKSYFIKISIIVLLMSLLSALTTDIVGLYTINVSGGFGQTRIYYCLGLLIAGILADKNKNFFEIITIVSFVFSLLTIILLKDGYSIKIASSLSYSFIGFFVLFRTKSFINISNSKKSMMWTCAFGLMYSRIMEGLMVSFENKLINHYILLIIIITILLSLVIVLYFLLYFQGSNISENDKVKDLSIKYRLGSQEEKVLNLLIKDFSNQEIADELYISVNTVRNHIANIYKKTGLKKKDLKEKCFYKTN